MLGAFVSCCCQREASRRQIGGLVSSPHFGCCTSLCVCLCLSPSRFSRRVVSTCCLSLGQSAASPAHLAQSRLRLRHHRPPSGLLPRTVSLCVCCCCCLIFICLPFLFLVPSVLQLKSSPLSSHIRLIYFLLSVQRVLCCCCCCCCCCNVSPLSVFQVSPHFLWAVNMLTLTHLQPSCVSLHGMSCSRVCRVSLSVLLCLLLIWQTWVKTSLHIDVSPKRSPVSPSKKCPSVDFPWGFYRGIRWWVTFIDLYWQPGISCSADSWCCLWQPVINTNNQVTFATDKRANYSRDKTEKNPKNIQIFSVLYFPLTALLSVDRCTCSLSICRCCSPQVCLL